MTPITIATACAVTAAGLAALAAWLLWCDHLTVADAEWDAHVADVLDVCGDPDAADFAAWARECGA